MSRIIICVVSVHIHMIWCPKTGVVLQIDALSPVMNMNTSTRLVPIWHKMNKDGSLIINAVMCQLSVNVNALSGV